MYEIKCIYRGSIDIYKSFYNMKGWLSTDAIDEYQYD